MLQYLKHPYGKAKNPAWRTSESVATGTWTTVTLPMALILSVSTRSQVRSSVYPGWWVRMKTQ